MRVIDHGNQYFTHICERCECKFEYLKKEIEIEENKPFCDKYKESITCPECGCRHYIKVIIFGSDITKKCNTREVQKNGQY